MSSYEPAPYRRWDPKPAWLAAHFHPAERGCTYDVKHFEDGTPFKATYGFDGVWRDEAGLTIKPDGLYWLSPTP